MTATTLKTSEVTSNKMVTLDITNANKLKNQRKVWVKPGTIQVTFIDGKFGIARIYDVNDGFIRMYTANDLKYGNYVPQWIRDAVKRAWGAKRVASK